MPVQPGYQETMVPFGAWLPDQGKNTAKPGFPLFWVNGSPVDLDDALNVVWTGGAYRPFLPPIQQNAALPVTPVDAHMTYRNATDNFIAGSGAALYWSSDGGVTWILAGSGYGGTSWNFVEYGNCVYATNGVNPIQSLDTTQPPAFVALAATTAPVAYVLGIIGDFVVAGNVVSSPIGAPTGANVIQWCGLAAPATWSVPNTQAARADQSGAQSLDTQYGKVQFIASGQALGMVFQQTGITRVQYVGGDIVFSFYTYERKRGLVNPRAVTQIGNTVFYLSNDGFYATDGTEVQPIGYSKVNRWFLADCTDLQAVRCSTDITNSLVIWAYPSASNASGYGQIIYNFAEGNWTRGNYASPLLFEGMLGQTRIPLTFSATNFVSRFDGAPADCELTTKDFRFDSSHHSLVVSLRVLCDNANATAGICARDQDSDPQTFVGYGAPEPVSRQISVRADGYMHSANVKIPGNFTYAQGIGYKYVNRGRR